MTARWQFNDGGRSEAGFLGETGDCVCRAIAIATGKPYLDVYDELTDLGWNCWEPWNPCYHPSTKDYWLKHSCYCDPDTDTYLYEEDFRQECNWREPADGSHIWPGESRWRIDSYLKSLGCRWTEAGEWTEASEVHLRADELPAGRLIVAIPEHLVAVIDGVIHDTFDCFRGGACCVYGWWSLPRRGELGDLDPRPRRTPRRKPKAPTASSHPQIAQNGPIGGSDQNVDFSG